MRRRGISSRLGDVRIPASYFRRMGALIMAAAFVVPVWLLRSAALDQAAQRQPAQGGDQSVRPVMIVLPAGTFTMGSPETEEERLDNEQQHTVSLKVPFAISITEVTQGQYMRLMAENPSADRRTWWGGSEDARPCSEFGVGEDLPVSCVSWFEAVEYANRLSDLEGLERCYQGDGESIRWPKGLQCLGYRLPTEAEWEYAARAGTVSRFAGTDRVEDVCQFGNVGDAAVKRKFPDWPTTPCDDGYPHLAPVARFQPNAWGLYDMTGNVWEWTWDWYEAELGTGPASDPGGAEAGSYRVLRGGSWHALPRYLRVANRVRDVPSGRVATLGFRLARSYP